MWKPMPDFEGNYEISDQGEVRNAKTGRILKTSTNKGIGKKDSYVHLRLPDGTGKYPTVYVHQKVAQAFVPNPDPEHNKVVMHKNNDKTDPRAENLEWWSQSENTLQAYADGLINLPDPYNKKNYIVTNHNDIEIWCHGQAKVAEVIGYTNPQSISNMVYANRPISKGPYIGLYVEFSDLRNMCNIVKR